MVTISDEPANYLADNQYNPRPTPPAPVLNADGEALLPQVVGEGGSAERSPVRRIERDVAHAQDRSVPQVDGG